MQKWGALEVQRRLFFIVFSIELCFPPFSKQADFLMKKGCQNETKTFAKIIKKINFGRPRGRRMSTSTTFWWHFETGIVIEGAISGWPGRREGWPGHRGVLDASRGEGVPGCRLDPGTDLYRKRSKFNQINNPLYN